LKSGVELWILTSPMVMSYAERMDYLDIVKTAGARVLCETCPSPMPRGLLKERGHKTAATNSAKMPFYLAGAQDILSYYGSMERCVEAAVSGIWR